ncbi:MAG: type VI secretion system baseplate subunit TssG [Desulfobacterales bacterium]
MAHTYRHEADQLKRSLTGSPKQFSYFQALRLLHRVAGDGSAFSEFLREHVRIRPPVSLGFADVDVLNIRDISTKDTTRFEITASFLGLYGPASPLPTYYTEELIEEAFEEESVKRDFLDIFNDRIFKLFYEAWSKYRLSVKIIDENDSESLNRLYSLIGLAEPEMRRRLPESAALLRYAGLFMCYPRSALGLQTLIADFFQLPGVEIEQCAERQVPIDGDQHCLLGLQACELGEDSHMGVQILDYSSRIRIRCGPMDQKEFHEMAPGTEWFDRLTRVINAYLDQPLSVDIRFIVYQDQICTATLGGPKWCQLGYHTWLISSWDVACVPEPNAFYGLQTALSS